MSLLYFHSYNATPQKMLVAIFIYRFQTPYYKNAQIIGIVTIDAKVLKTTPLVQ